MPQIITLTTDFGLKDSYVAEVKAVLLSYVPTATLIDITHEISPYQVEEGAFQLLRAYRWFPASACHLAVVDPGVGGSRKNIFVKTAHGSFVGPDNGVLLWAIRDAERVKRKAALAYEIPPPSTGGPTFWGRDCFAPFLGEHLKGKKHRLKRLTTLNGRDFPQPTREGKGVKGEALHVDSFGNVVTNIPAETDRATLNLGKLRIHSASNYDSIPHAEAALLRGSHGFWEISCRRDSASRRLKIKKGDTLTLVS